MPEEDLKTAVLDYNRQERRVDAPDYTSIAFIRLLRALGAAFFTYGLFMTVVTVSGANQHYDEYAVWSAVGAGLMVLTWPRRP